MKATRICRGSGCRRTWPSIEFSRCAPTAAFSDRNPVIRHSVREAFDPSVDVLGPPSDGPAPRPAEFHRGRKFTILDPAPNGGFRNADSLDVFIPAKYFFPSDSSAASVTFSAWASIRCTPDADADPAWLFDFRVHRVASTASPDLANSQVSESKPYSNRSGCTRSSTQERHHRRVNSRRANTGHPYGLAATQHG